MKVWDDEVRFDLSNKVGRVKERVMRGGVKEVGDGSWDVVGWADMGETREWYLVVRFDKPEPTRFVCTCSRGSTCEHILTVRLWLNRDGQLNAMREMVGAGSGDGSGAGDESGSGVGEIVDDVPVKVEGVPYPGDAVWNGERWPEWVETFREHQWIAAKEIVAAFEDGADVVILEAPTGSGKTLIGEMVRRLMKARALYVCSDKQLQDQFGKDFPYAKVLKGRSNYPTLDGPKDVTCADCTKSRGADGGWVCHWCDEVHACPYEVAKGEALASDLAVVNTSYLLAEANNVGRFSKRGLVVVDEADVLERELMGFVELFIGDRVLERLARSSGTGIVLHMPGKGARRETIVEWLKREFLPMVDKAIGRISANETDHRRARERAGWQRRSEDVNRFIVELERSTGGSGNGSGNGSGSGDAGIDRADWVRDNDAPGLSMKPVAVDEPATRLLWPHGKKWLLMSATIISADEMVQSLGIERAGLRSVVVRVPMTFPVENRKVRVIAAADMSMKGKNAGEWEYAKNAIAKIVADHPHDRVLVHCVSYPLMREMKAGVRERIGERVLIGYESAGERAEALARFARSDNGVLFAPSMDRGVDLPGDACRVVVIAKVPYPYVGDKQISARMNRGREGATWYAVQTVRTIVQMTGRGVRSKDDWAVGYIIDSQFGKLLGRYRKLFPKWWLDAVDTRTRSASYREYGEK